MAQIWQTGRHERLVTLLTILSVAAITFLQGWTLDDRYSWFGDGGLYLQHARNILRGADYTYHTYRQTFPPGYPLILAGWGELFGFTFESLKQIAVISIGALAMGAFFLARAAMGIISASIIALAVAASPLVTAHRYIISSDLVFSAAAIWAIVCWNIAVSRATKYQSWQLVFWCGVLFSIFAIFTRVAGLPFYLTALVTLYIIARNKKLKPHEIFTYIGSLLLYIFTIIYNINYTNLYTDYVKQEFDAGVKSSGSIISFIIDHIYNQYQQLTDSVIIGWRDQELQKIYDSDLYLFVKVFLLLLIFYSIFILIFRKNNLVSKVFFLSYLLQIILTPWSGGTRYYILLLPFFLITIHIGLGNIRVAYLSPMRLAFFTLSLLWMMGISFRIHDNVRNSYAMATTMPMIQWVQDHTAPEDLVCSFNANNMAYFLDRQVCPLSLGIRERLMESGVSTLHALNAKYVIIPLNPDYSWIHSQFGKALIEKNELKKSYENTDYVVLAPRNE